MRKSLPSHIPVFASACCSLVVASLCGPPVRPQTPALKVSVSYSANLRAVKVADLNNDNAPEIIGLDANAGSNALVVLKNTGTGSYGAAQYYPLSADPRMLDVGDFNADGYLDVAVAVNGEDPGTAWVAVLRGNGDGTLQMAQSFTVPIPSDSIVVADFNNDNRPDIAGIGSINDPANNLVANTVTILTNTSTSTASFSFASRSFPASVYYAPHGLGTDSIHSLTVGDFNGDERLDLAYIDDRGGAGGNESALFILANTTAGWVGKKPIFLATVPTMTAADLDGDGITDLIIPFIDYDIYTKGVLVYYMKSDFSVAAKKTPLSQPYAGPIPAQVVAGDFNNDGRTDIAGYSPGGWDVDGNLVPPGIMVWTGLGARTFSLTYYNQPGQYNRPGTGGYTGVGFLDKNGTRDLVVPNDMRTQVWKNGTVNPNDPCPYPTSPGIHICKPAGAVPEGTVHFLASARANVQPLKRMGLWVDGKKRAQRFSDRLHVDLTLPPGTHTASFYEVGANDRYIKKTITLTVQ